MKMHEMFPANFLKKEDAPQPIRVTIENVTMEEVTGDGGKEMKATLHFEEDVKPMILNKGNATTICESFGDDTAAWHGKVIEVFTDPSVMYGGKRIGGLRVRVPAQPARPAPVNTSMVPNVWDVSDGQNVLPNQTSEQVRAMIAGGVSPTTLRLKPAGADRSQAKTADAWGFQATEFAHPVKDDGEIPW